jgi:hypothetical protein
VGFVRYQHVERLGTDNVEGILDGEVYVFPKIDGTNGSIWYSKEDKAIRAGSRNRLLTVDSDNADFYKSVSSDSRYEKFFKNHPNLRLFGEWLVPHTLRTYVDSAWRKFYVFDVMDEDFQYLHYEEYKEILSEYEIDFIPAICTVIRPSEEYLNSLLDKNDYLVSDGVGEGILIKRYNYRNKYGRVTWAKIVRNDFRWNHKRNETKEYKTPTGVEEKFVNNYATEVFLHKEFSKIDNWTPQKTPAFLGITYNTLITEELWDFIKKQKDPKIDFKTLRKLVTNRSREWLLNNGKI